ncbi:ribonuclease Y [Candidatus Peregrinibacteria bacterium]|nr:ribonuclease Y [Candidatus Peregrinibacteria bacterium]
MQNIIGIIIGFLVGGGAIVAYYTINSKRRIQTIESEAEEKVQKARKQLEETEQKARIAESKSREIILDAKNKAMEIREEVKQEEKQVRQQLERGEERLVKKEEQIEKEKEELLKKAQELIQKREILEKESARVHEVHKKQEEELTKISKLTQEEAKKMLLEKVEVDYKDEIVAHYKKVEEDVKEESEKRSKDVIVAAIQKYASEVASESTTTMVALPSDDMKGRIIGREGRNINAFEQMTGVDVIVDDTPGTIIISGFDLVRRYVAKRALEQLIEDGRIQPARIEATIQKAQEEVNTMIKEFGEKAAFELGVTGLHPDLIRLVGRLRFRTSYGQNVLRHCIEVGFLSGALASEVGADVKVAKTAGFLHDIGKAVDHEVEGPHALIGRDIARKFRLPEEIIHAIEAHHEDVKITSTEALIVQAADAISASRPGARRESLEKYIKRLKDLEGVANSFPGIERSFAIQAGREVRILVKPNEVDDLGALKLSHDIARKIESELAYPGQIKVHVIRETRSVDFAK